MDYYDPAEHAPMYVDAGPTVERPRVHREPPQRVNDSWKGKYRDLPDEACYALMGFRGSLRDAL